MFKLIYLSVHVADISLIYIYILCNITYLSIANKHRGAFCEKWQMYKDYCEKWLSNYNKNILQLNENNVKNFFGATKISDFRPTGYIKTDRFSLRNRNDGKIYPEIVLFPKHIVVVWQRMAIWRFSNTHERLIETLAGSNDV